ncbi:hypothetical protein [Paracidovorax wautersii]|uniref:hypothetical protein n=1 Tax=Paracidovorax wautersii TaxID=1177982 RepID=UPI0031DDA9BB
MKTVDETRRIRLDMLLEKYGSFANLNEALGWTRTDSRLSRIKNQNQRTDRDGKTFMMGSPMARSIEVALQLPTGWMDTPPTYDELSKGDDARAKALEIMEHLPADQWNTAVRLLAALAEPNGKRNGTNGSE